MEQKVRILTVAQNALFKSGYRNFRVDDIAKSVGISKKTLYEHFPSKESIVEEIINNSIRDFNHEMENIIKDIEKSNKDDFFSEITKLMYLISEHANFFSGEVIEDIRKNFPKSIDRCERFDTRRKDRFMRVLKVGIDRNLIRSDIDPEILYLIHNFALKGFLEGEVIAQISLSIREVIAKVYEVIFIGNLTDEGRELFLKTNNK